MVAKLFKDVPRILSPQRKIELGSLKLNCTPRSPTTGVSKTVYERACLSSDRVKLDSA
jgi:hypothetical protein